MTTYYYFQSESRPELQGFTDSPTGQRLPPENGPWTLLRQVTPDSKWPHPASKAAAVAAVALNGFYLCDEPVSGKPIIESDRVEGTAVFDPSGRQIGTIERLLIEKVSGRVQYVDITFGGFLGIGAHHHTIPWEKLAFETSLGGYRTDITEEQVRGAPAFYGEERLWPDREREQQTHAYWRTLPPPF